MPASRQTHSDHSVLFFCKVAFTILYSRLCSQPTEGHCAGNSPGDLWPCSRDSMRCLTYYTAWRPRGPFSSALVPDGLRPWWPQLTDAWLELEGALVSLQRQRQLGKVLAVAQSLQVHSEGRRCLVFPAHLKVITLTAHLKSSSYACQL